MFFKKFFLFAFIVFGTFSLSFFAKGISVSAESAVVMNSDTGEILFQKNAEERLSMASTTKIMTCLLALESGKLNSEVKVGALEIEGTSIGLKEGYKINLYDLCCGMLLSSGNDAAIAVAEYLSGSEENFSILMNRKAKSLGLKNTSFETASGLDSDNHYSTALDMARLGSFAIKNPIFKDICSKKQYKADLIEPEISLYFKNHNKLLSYCDGVFGIKTGFTKKSGRCLVSCCERDGTTLVCVTLSAPDDWNDHERLFNYCFENIQREEIPFIYPAEIKLYSSDRDTLKLKCERESYLYSYHKKEDLNYKIFLPKFIYAPVTAGDKVGKIVVYCGEREISTVDILAFEEAKSVSGSKERKKNFFEKIFSFIKRKES